MGQKIRSGNCSCICNQPLCANQMPETTLEPLKKPSQSHNYPFSALALSWL